MYILWRSSLRAKWETESIQLSKEGTLVPSRPEAFSGNRQPRGSVWEMIIITSSGPIGNPIMTLYVVYSCPGDAHKNLSFSALSPHSGFRQLAGELRHKRAELTWGQHLDELSSQVAHFFFFFKFQLKLKISAKPKPPLLYFPLSYKKPDPT